MDVLPKMFLTLKCTKDGFNHSRQVSTAIVIFAQKMSSTLKRLLV